jgi:signal transduction histidine kinase
VNSRRLHIYLIPLAFALLVAVLIALNLALRYGRKPHIVAGSLPYRFRDVITARVTMKSLSFVTDVDLDGNDDLLINTGDRLLWYRFGENALILAGQGVYERSGNTMLVTDVNGDGYPDFLVTADTHKGWIISCHDWFSPKGPSTPIYTIGPMRPTKDVSGKPSYRLLAMGSFTAEEGAHPTVFIGQNAGKDEFNSRSLRAYDGATGKELWHFDFAPYNGTLVCGNVRADIPCVVLSTVAVANGVSWNNTTDSLSYLFCLDERNGNLLWKKELGGVAGRSDLALADINGDGLEEILVARYLSAIDPLRHAAHYPWTVAALNGEGDILATATLPFNPQSVSVADLDDDATSEILVEGRNGILAILNHDLTIRRLINPPVTDLNPSIRVFGVEKLVGRGEPDILCQENTLLMVREQTGKMLAARNFPTCKNKTLLARYNGSDHAVTTCKDSIRVMVLERTPLAIRLRAHAERLTIAALMASIVFGVGGFHLRRYFRRRREGPLILEGIHSDLLRAMSAFGHGGSSLRVIDRIRLHLKNWDRVQADAAARGELFARLHATFVETVMSELEHIAMLAHRALVPEDIWGTMLVRAGIADKEMEAILAAGSGEPVSGKETHIAAALQALEDVDTSLARIRAYLRSVFRTPIVEALEHAAARFRAAQGTREISLSLPSDVPAAESVFIRPIVFEKVLENLLANAARACEARADAAIAIEVHWEGNYCKIDVRDNGCGIPRDEWERVFERSYTTKVEGGFGLYYAHEELARFNGRIFVLDSAVGAGTTMRIVLRKS